MNKTVYLRDDEVPIWERARELADDKLSPIIVSALKSFILQKEAEAKDFQRIVFKYLDADAKDFPKAKGFYGKWIFSPNSRLHQDQSSILPISKLRAMGGYAVALTAKGGVVVVLYVQPSSLGLAAALSLGLGGLDDLERARFKTFPSLGHAAADAECSSAIHAAITAMGLPVEELDI